VTVGSAPYHHGDLPATLRAAAVEVIVDKGLGAFSLREVARRADVSHAAPGYHFGDVRGLLTAVAIEGFERLRDETRAAGVGIEDPAERLRSIGQAYVRVGRTYPGHCQVIFRNDVIDSESPALQHVGLEAYAVLEDTVRDLAERSGATYDITDAARLCWSAMQGLVQLQDKFEMLDLMGDRRSVDIEAQAARFTDLILAGLR
jgi:AcrR family transcriptional regulator